MIDAGFIQYDVQFRQRIRNFETASEAIKANPAADLLVLPELAFSGYDFPSTEELAQTAETFNDGATTTFLKEQAKKHNTILIAGYPEAENDHYFNSAMMVSPSGETHNYRKTHLFSYETKLFQEGNEKPPIINTDWGKIGIMICFDWFFPETTQYLAMNGAQLIAHPSNLVLDYCQQAMYCRCVENALFAITANRIGTEHLTDRELIFTGGSQILSPKGKVLAKAAIDHAESATASLNLSEAMNKDITPFNHRWNDQRTDLFGDSR
jgi:predicted amidohydrolase